MNKENKMQDMKQGAVPKSGKNGQASNDLLPQINKFSSWAKEDQNLNELDELLNMDDLLNESPAAKKQNRTGISATIHVTKNNRTSSPDHFDLEEVMDEFGEGIEAGGGDLEKNTVNRNQLNEDSNSFDLDNSDDLNRFIQKYETMLDGEGANKQSGSKLAMAKQSSATKPKDLVRDKSKDLEDSWGSLQFQAEQMLGSTIEDETSPVKKKSGTSMSANTTSAAVQSRIVEDEIIAEEIRLAHQQQKSAQKKFGSRRRSSDANVDIIDDFDNEFEDETENRKTDEDAIVDEVEEEDALRMIDEEIMNTAVGKTDAKKIKELINKIDGGPRAELFTETRSEETSLGNSFSNKNKPVDQQTKFSSSSKVVVSKYSKSNSKQNLHESNSIFGGRKTPTMDGQPDNKYENEPEDQDDTEDHHLQPLGGSEDDIDEFIKRHMGEEESKKGVKTEEEKAMLLAKAKELLGEDQMPASKDEETDMMEESLSDSDGSADMDGEQLTPKQSLLNGLVRLGNPRAKNYSATDREHFVIDLENILKVLTFKETVAFIFPVLDIYAAEEEDELKIELFKKLPFVFKKLMKSPARPSDQDALDLLTVNIFPLISQILMTSDDQVQEEGVSALHTISEDYLPRDEAIFLVFNVVQLLTKKADQIDNAKTAVLMLIEKFANTGYFGKKECMVFLNTNFASFMENALFKIKKRMLPCLLALSKQIDYSDFKDKVLTTYMEFSKDSIWGVRRVAIELLPEFLAKIEHTETDNLLAGLEFLKRSLNDDSKWVKNQAFLQFGKAVHEVYLKAQKAGAQKHLIMNKVLEVSNAFLNLDLLTGHLGASTGNLEESKNKIQVSSCSQDEIDKIKECWAFNFPCVLLVNGGKTYWASRAKAVYKVLYKDVLLNVRRSLAASLVEVARLIGFNQELDENDDGTFMVEVANQFLGDSVEIKQKLLPKLSDFVSLYPKENQQMLLNTMIRERLENDNERKTASLRVQLLEQVFQTFDVAELVEAGFHQFIYEAIKSEQMVGNRVRVAKVFGSQVVAKLIKSKKYRKDLTDFVDDLRISTNFRNRQMYLHIASATFEADQEIYKKHFAKAIGNEMLEERVTVVKCLIAKLVNTVTTGYSKSTDKIGDHLKAQNNSEVNQFLSDDNIDIGKRRYLDPAAITTKLKAEEEDEAAEADKKKEGEAKEENKTEEEKLSAGEEEEKKEIATYEKTVQIKLCNYSILVRAAQFSSGLSAQLIALLGGYGSLLFGNQSNGGKKMLDDTEEKMLQQKDKDEEAKKGKENQEEEEEEDTW